MQGGVEAEACDDVLAAVVGEDTPGRGRAGEGAFGADTEDGRVEGQVNGQRLGEAVCVVVGDVADLCLARSMSHGRFCG